MEGGWLLLIPVAAVVLFLLTMVIAGLASGAFSRTWNERKVDRMLQRERQRAKQPGLPVRRVPPDWRDEIAQKYPQVEKGSEKCYHASFGGDYCTRPVNHPGPHVSHYRGRPEFYWVWNR